MSRRCLRQIAAFALLDLLIALGVASPAQRPAAPGPAPTETTTAAAAGDAFGDAHHHGSMRGTRLAQPVVGIAGTRSGSGYWLVARDGGIFSFGDAVFHGSTGAIRLNQPIVGITTTPSGNGYWFVASDGGVFSFGDAAFRGSTGAIRLNQPIVGMAATPSGKGYWLVASDGGIFAFGDAVFHGSTGAIRLNQPIVGMASTPTGRGYWLVARDGGVFAFGDAAPRGSAAGRSGQAIVGMARAAAGAGYWLTAIDGAVFSFGAADSFGSVVTSSRVVGIASTPTGRGFWLATSDGDVLSAPGQAVPDGTFGFLRIGRNGKPVRYNPCEDVHYVVNTTLAPAGAVAEVHEAFRRVGAATGMRFVYDGATTEVHVPFGKRDTYQPERYGNRWAPILISWAPESVEPLLAGGTLGYGGSTSYWSSSSDESFVTGEAVFDTQGGPLGPGFGTGLTRGNLIQHEIGHLIGLDHVDDRSQMMYPSVHGSTPSTFAAGDLAGLRQLGAASGCLDVADPR